jgi:CBS domain containing-hemolysin-like protein
MAATLCSDITYIAAAQIFLSSLWELLLMLILLVGSAFFSGAETAFFNLSRRQVAELKKSPVKLQKLAAKLIAKPARLLSCLLFGNMMVNVLFFAAASVLTVKAGRNIGITAAALTAFASFLVLLLAGEILPKSLAYANSRSFSITAALPAYLCLQILRPILAVLRFLIVEPAIRLIIGPTRKIQPVTSSEFKLLIDQVRKRGLITDDENRLFTEIVQLGYLKVRDCLKPRVDMVTCTVTDSNKNARDIMQNNHLTKIAVYAESIDNIVGLLHLRDLLLNPDTPLDKLVRKVHFVPEQKTVESLLELFRKTKTDTAIVVDEYGGIDGSIQLEDIAEELIGPIEAGEKPEPIESIGPLEYRLAGNLPIHDWAEVFGIEITNARYSTIGGLVTSLLGKIPKNGDVAKLKNLKFTVEKVHKHRIETLILTLEQIPDNGT